MFDMIILIGGLALLLTILLVRYWLNDDDESWRAGAVQPIYQTREKEEARWIRNQLKRTIDTPFVTGEPSPTILGRIQAIEKHLGIETTVTKPIEPRIKVTIKKEKK